MTNDEIKKDLISVRQEYIDKVKVELVGPGSEFSIPDSEHELISSPPSKRYSAGILFPQENKIGLDNDEVNQGDNENADSDMDFEENSDSASDEGEESDPGAGGKEHYYESPDPSGESLDEEVNLSTQYFPSSLGMTFFVKGSTDTVKCSIKFATYRRAHIEECVIPFRPENPDNYEVPSEVSDKISYDKKRGVLQLKGKLTGKEVKEILGKDTASDDESKQLSQCAYRLAHYANMGYVRDPHEIPDYTINFNRDNFVEGSELEYGGVPLKVSALRNRMSDNLWSITVMLVNASKEKISISDHCIFQPEIKVSSENNDFVFEEIKSNPTSDSMDEEELELNMQYRNKKDYGSGLGTAVDWKIDQSGRGYVKTEIFPTWEVPSMDFSLPKNDEITLSELSMKYYSDLVTATKQDRINSLRKFVNLYNNWINDLENKAKTMDPPYSATASKNIASCKESYERMCAGIDTLEKDSQAWDAFMLANRAMFMQRIHINMQRKMAEKDADRYNGDREIEVWLNNLDYRKEDDQNSRWRPFQLAFILMDVNSIVYDDSKDRLMVDLIWFPTGGGKTEAYLGLTAFTIFFRRLKHLKESGGTAIIMRYTLRLLTSQQFTRASTLICACEYIRKDSAGKRPKYPAYPLGNDPITIGLWIGNTHIPNKNDEAKKDLKKLTDATRPYQLKYAKERYNKFQVLKCPWCGTKMVKDVKDGKVVGKWGYNISSRGNHFYMFCPNEICDFSASLPIQIIDEELYRQPPTLLFGTVDKFAMMPWEGKTGAFFGTGDNRAPELIVQDELHLISGALGTMVGLYETAVDGLCQRKGIPEKIIASTATIRRAGEQCSVLYNREVAQFPAPGLDAEDSFFAKENPVNYDKGVFGRMYVGIMPSGQTKAMTEARAMAAMLQCIYMMDDLPDQVRDKLWTLTVYFNNLKDLGKASNLVSDDVKDFIIRMANRLFAKRRLIVSSDELTSRITTTDLNETLDKLEKIEYSQENRKSHRWASNVLLATNMISVGIDIARLNVMLMVGQPKLTSEYIQASSRVGREFPGTVFIQYDSTKSRDRSHYEHFRPYHEAFYRYVEPTGATPFSKPARDRALHAVVTSLIRQKEGLTGDDDARYFDYDCFESDLNTIENFVVNRMKDINHRSFPALKDDSGKACEEMEEFIEKWQKEVNECNSADPVISLCFGKQYMMTSAPDPSLERRLLKPFNSGGHDDATETLTSMRNVDTQVSGQIIVWEDSHYDENKES